MRLDQNAHAACGLLDAELGCRTNLSRRHAGFRKLHRSLEKAVLELISVTVTGYRRFRSRTSLQTNGKLIAILGPNEAGKSSLLRAITHLGHGRGLAADEVSRDFEPEDVRIVGRFHLDADETVAARLSGPRSLTVTKHADGRRQFGFDPPAPDRDVSHREPLAYMLRKLAKEDFVTEGAVDDELATDFEELAAALEASSETVSKTTLASLGELADRLGTLLESIADPIGATVLKQLGSAIELEVAPTPLHHALKAMEARVPAFLLFDEDARSLASEYSLDELREKVPTALANLAEVAGLDFARLFAAIDAGQTSRITTIEHRASEVLSERFRAAWRQSGPKVALRVQGDLLEVQIVNGDHEHTALAERSDGLRQFVALQMFATRNHADRPVLLVDEADLRLHYDAQADLVQMLARQQLSPKVIYTTHSAGCLPEDLGNGVRTILPREDDGTSLIENRFWARGGGGLTPLLMGMGASTMAFFPTRRAVMVEGASDMLLYPTLFREALAGESLGYQFVPGLSQVRKEQVLSDGLGVAYLVDGDDGGATIRRRLLEMGVPEAAVFVMRNPSGSAIELEDFVSEDRLVAAANAILAKRHPGAAQPMGPPAREGTRMEALEAEFLRRAGVRLPKVDLAYELLDQLYADPTSRLLDPRRLDAFREVARAIGSRLNQG